MKSLVQGRARDREAVSLVPRQPLDDGESRVRFKEDTVRHGSTRCGRPGA